VTNVRAVLSATAADTWPLLELFPRLADLPRLSLRANVTPVEHLESVAPALWIKRDDLTATDFGGNKIRSLEFLLGGGRAGDRVTTVGSMGSTHALATALVGRSIGADVSVGLWPQEMNPVAERVAAELRERVQRRKALAHPAIALAWLSWRSMRGDRVIPAGGTSPLGILGHVNAALELARQIERGVLPEPAQIVVPLGSGGTAAGLALGFAIAGLHPTIIGTRVVPKIVGRAGRVARLVRATTSLIERRARVRLDVDVPRISVMNEVYGGAYGRPLDRAEKAGRTLEQAIGVSLDATYSAKAFAAALDAARVKPTLFWLTFDSRWLKTTLK
jgi:1-aminocyclopropane-1-carboxylate deaminase/D-cysteine desulfhydrase-like pyridoxal-dependent ACC family enzyme